MTIKRLMLGCLAILLATCSRGPSTLAPIDTALPTLPPGVAPSDTPFPTFTPSPTPTPEVRLKTGDLALANGDYLLAQSEYQAALSTATNSEMQAAALWGLGQVEYAIANNGKTLLDLWNLTGNYSDSPNAVRAYFIMGETYMRLERYTEAAEAFTTYLALRPGVIDYYVQERRGDAYSAAQNYVEAIPAYQAALAAPHIEDDATLQMKIAQAYTSSGDTASAIGIYDSIIAGNSNDYVKAQADLLSGRIFFSLGQTDQAYQRFNHAVDNYPTSYDSYSALVALVSDGITVDQMNRGLVDYFAGQYGYALDAFYNYINTNPDNDGTAYYYIALTLRGKGHYQEAVDAFTNFINQFPDNRFWEAAWDEKADTQRVYLEQYNAAAQTLLDYANADPGSSYIPQTIFSAGQNYERAGLLDEAARVWSGIADSYPSSELVPQALFSAGIALYRNAEYTQALVSFQRVTILTADPFEQARAFFWVGKTQQILGDSTSAQAAWQQAASFDSTDYYSLRAQDMLLDRPAFSPPIATNLTVDLAAERRETEAWLRLTFNLPTDTDLNNLGTLLSDPHMVKGTELWTLGLEDEARLEFEELRSTVQGNPADTYRLANYLLDLGLYRPAIFAARQVLTLAGMTTQYQTLAAPRYFNHVRYGLYYQDLIFPAAQQGGFDALFLTSVIRQESLFEGFVQSVAGARGLMQIIPSTGQYIVDNFGWPPDYTSADLYRPIVSINLGTNYLMNNRSYFNGDLYDALAAYNAGPSNAAAWRNLSGDDPDLFLETIRIQETRDYIRSIYENFNMYTMLYGVAP
ncbi:MAG: tetratricopeptide repeat protein [Chloroflexota bacterium]